jgi:hypothetical protein
MPIITIYIKNKANSKDLLNATKIEIGDSVIFDVEKPPRESVVSKAPLDIHEIKEVAEYLRQLLQADSLVRISIESIIGNIAWNGFIKSITPLKKFLVSNNKQKGNAWGVKVEVKRITNEKKEQILCFFLDNISEEKLFNVIGKIENKIKEVDSTLGNIYLDQLKNIGFTFNNIKDEWEIMGAEKFDGSIVLPSAKTI